MESRPLDGLYGRAVVLDICRGCEALWFDDLEFLQLSPGATLDLFASFADRDGPARPQPLPPRLECPRCRAGLVETHDLQRNTRFAFFRCPAGHGRLLPFYQFLRAKNFVRSLDAGEIAELRQRVRQVNCANCGAPVNLERDAACGFCRSPVAMLDAGQVAATVKALRAAEERRLRVDPTFPVRLLSERARAERAFATPAELTSLFERFDGRPSRNLVDAGLRAIGRWLSDAATR